MLGVLVSALFALSAAGQTRSSSPASKVFVSDVRGTARIDTGEKVHELSRRSVFYAEGAVIETLPTDASARNRGYSTMVYSNGTGAFFDVDTRVEVKKFVQEPFTPTRTDVDVEPSISVTHVFLARGTVGLCTSKLVAGSSMVYQTPHATVSIQGRKIVIEVTAQLTRVSMVDGEGSVRAGPQDAGGHTIRAGEQALVTRGAPGQANMVEIRRIPPDEAPLLDEKVTAACMARRTVYFDMREPSSEAGAAAGRSQTGSPGLVNAFFGNSAAGTSAAREIVAVPVAPANLPVPFVVSPANLTSPDH